MTRSGPIGQRSTPLRCCLSLVGSTARVSCVACSSPHVGAAPGGSPDTGEEAGTPGGAGADANDGGVPESGSEGGAGVRWIGRVDLSSDARPAFAWSGTGFVATVSGPTISVSLTTTGSSDPVFFQPVIDGTPGSRFSIADGNQTVTLASSLADGGHTVELYRETEGRYGVSTFQGFTDGTLQAPAPAPGRLIEVVGDSITAGYGDLGSEEHPNGGPDPDGGCTFSTLTESAYVTYGAVAARMLGADVSLIAVSGWGIYRDDENDTSNVLPAVYPDTLGLQTSPSWSFQPEPQAVVINLGTNDFAMGDPGQMPFESAYSAFVSTIRGKYPHTWIFCAVGPLLYGTSLTTATSYIQDVVSSAQAQGDTKVQFLQFAEEDSSLGTGCQYHPNVAEHQAMATTLVAALQLALGW